MAALERKWWTLIAVCIAVFMLLLDITVVNVALPDIQRSLHASFSDLQWVVDAYSLTLAAFLLTAGVIGDMFGRREVFAIGLGIFTISSFLCGVSTTSLMLDLCRGLQGVGGAVMFATSLALIAQAFSGRERGTAFGIYGAVIGGAVAVGPLVGGAITSAFGWRWIFFINVPIGIVAVLLTLAKISESKDPTKRRVDWVGFVTFSVALFLLVFALVRGNDLGWGSTAVITMLVGAAVFFAGFIVGELVQRDPMLDLNLFRRPAVVGASLTAFCVASSVFAMFLYLTLYIQDALNYGPLQAGLRFLPITLMAFVVAPIAGRLSVRIHARILLGTGMLLVAAGLFTMSFLTADSQWTALLPGFVLAGIGIGTVNPVLASAAVGVVPPNRSGMASGANNTFRQVGIATGIAALGAVFAHEMTSKITHVLANTAAGGQAMATHGAALKTAFTSGQVRSIAASLPTAQGHAIVDAYRSAFASSLDLLLTIGAIVALIGAIGAFALVRQRDFITMQGGPGPEGGAAPRGGGGAPSTDGERAPSAAPAETAPVETAPAEPAPTVP